MPRTARVTAVHEPHHVFHQSAGNKSIFSTEKDRLVYLELLSQYARKYKLDVLAWCLMKNRVHLVVVPRTTESLAKAVGRTHFSFAQYIGKKRKGDQKVWRNRFQSCALDKKWLGIAVQSVECQPVREKLVRKAESYSWSSAAAHVSGKDPHAVLASNWPRSAKRKTWSRWVNTPADPDALEKLRMFTQTGRPLGSDAFVKKLERKFRRRLKPLPIGRPPKK